MAVYEKTVTVTTRNATTTADGETTENTETYTDREEVTTSRPHSEDATTTRSSTDVINWKLPQSWIDQGTFYLQDIPPGSNPTWIASVLNQKTGRIQRRKNTGTNIGRIQKAYAVNDGTKQDSTTRVERYRFLRNS